MRTVSGDVHALPPGGALMDWYALRTRLRMESGGSNNLRIKGYEAFLPTFKKQRNWSDRSKTVDLPLFPGYRCCRHDVTKRLPMLMMPGVHCIVCVGGVPVPIDPAEIETIRAVMGSGLDYEPHPYISVGQKVRIKEGVFS